MKAKKIQDLKKVKKMVVMLQEDVKPKQKTHLLTSLRLKNKQLKNYKAFFKYLVSRGGNVELADESD